ncbi:FAD-binding oxidoreductase [Poseidonocella sedimentorum]|uniref:FAD/FMN-containing dehydrogenase n=1 Tax=Poseidonocella sedimentorum TaxID=871652 RepID=A0A1I6CPS6_9RHOB|nr:FAD-binding oxidoreductase [Poseidonocella sedimentorum]SFQ95158.1 FAD/FMN-containing dehydrogenase [Poseidonocella sedimentorum]
MTLASVTEAHREALAARLPEAVFRPLAPAYLEEPRGRYRGEGGLLLAPATVEEVSTILRFANAERLAVVPYGGGTGLVGGQIAAPGRAPIILSLERMDQIRAVFAEENVIIAEAGVILETLHSEAEAVGRLFPLSLAAKGSARIGGNLATNAGGVNVLRYGNARDLCLGLEAVLPSGEIWHGLTRLRKDNTGYDLRNLLIGSEGTLGVITAAALKLFPRPAGEGTALLVVESPEAALGLLSMARAALGEGISAFELMSAQGLEFLAGTMPELRQPFGSVPGWSVLIELGLARGLDPVAALEGLFVEAAEAGLVSDGVIAQSGGQREALWALRENLPEANRRIGSVSNHDISVPLGALPEMIARGREELGAIDAFRVNCFGHVGDGNLHYNVFPMPGKTRADHDHQRAEIKTALHDLVHELGGSVSAEHGIGRMKVEDLERYGNPAKLAAMRAIKSALDPNGIMNPGAVLREG